MATLAIIDRFFFIEFIQGSKRNFTSILWLEDLVAGIASASRPSPCLWWRGCRGIGSIEPWIWCTLSSSWSWHSWHPFAWPSGGNPWFLWFHAAFWRDSSLAICLLKEVFTKRRGKGSSAVVLTCLCFDMIFSSKNARLWRFLETFVSKRLKKVNNVVGHALFDSCPANASFADQGIYNTGKFKKGVLNLDK